MTNISTAPVQADLRAWAKGMTTVEAAAELLIRGMDGRFAEPGNPWIKYETDGGGSQDRRYWVDLDAIDGHLGSLSGGEQAFLQVVASPGSDNVQVNLSDAITRLDRPTRDLVHAAIEHAAAGTSASVDIAYDEEGEPRFVKVASLYPWPA